MTKPVVGVIGSAHVVFDSDDVQLAGQRNLRAVAEVAGALPMMFAGAPDITDIDALLGAVDGVLLTGARANVHPVCFGAEPDPRHCFEQRTIDRVLSRIFDGVRPSGAFRWTFHLRVF